jgi:hypothetical protein
MENSSDSFAGHRLICIEYPALVKDVPRMLRTLGGVEQLSRSHSSGQPRIELRFRPSDPFAHAVFGDRSPSNSLLMRTRAVKRTYADGRVEVTYDTKPIGVIDTVYRFKSLCDFQYLPMKRVNPVAPTLTDTRVTSGSAQNSSSPVEPADLLDLNLDNLGNLAISLNQTDPVDSTDLKQPDQGSSTLTEIGTKMLNKDRSHSIETQNNPDFVRNILNERANQEKPRYRSISSEVLCNNVFDWPAKAFDANAPSFMLPIIFSRFDLPSFYFYRNDPKHRDKAIADEIERQNKLSIIGRNRKSRSVLAYLINWNVKVPTAPDPKLQQQLEPETDDNGASRAQSSKGSAFHVDYNLLNQLRACFEQRPIWSRNALVFKLNCHRQDIRHLLTCCAFYYNNGPFRGMWVRFGYDPREHPECKIYQTLDFRLKHHSIVSSSRSSAGRFVTMKKAINDKKARVALIHQDTFGLESGSVKSMASKTSTDEIDVSGNKVLASFRFQPSIVPLYRQTFYQLLDIDLDEVQSIVHSNDGSEEVCDERDGWLTSGSIERIRGLMNTIVEQTIKCNPKNNVKPNSSCSEDGTVDEDVDDLDDEEVDEEMDDDELEEDDEFDADITHGDEEEADEDDDDDADENEATSELSEREMTTTTQSSLN